MRLSRLLRAALVAFSAWTCMAKAAAPNILLIIADDYGADSSSLYNTNAAASLPPTPNIVSLAQSGVLFRNAYANPVCSPTRACLITGRHGFRTGVGDVVMGAGSATLSASEFTVAEAFAANPALGYEVAAFGKWHLALGANSPATIGGWPHFAGSLQGAISSYTNWTKTVNGTSTTSTNYATTDLVNDAVTWIQSKGTNRWFAWVAFNAPHTPLHKPPASLCPHYTSLSGTTADINNNPRKYFEAMTEAMDTEIGRLIATVNRTNTYIIFMGDNGTMGNVIQPPYPSTRGKDTLYEGGIHVPLIIAGPGVSVTNATNQTLVHAVDLFSTILDMAGINVATTIPAGVTIDSKSILPALTNNSSLTRWVYAEKFGTNTAAATGRTLRNSQFKLVRFDSGSEKLYDLLSDPYEGTNLLNGVLSDVQLANYYALTLRLCGYQQTLAAPVVSNTAKVNSGVNVTVSRDTNLVYSLWRSPTLEELSWAPVTNPVIGTNGGYITLTDTNALAGELFYRVVAEKP